MSRQQQAILTREAVLLAAAQAFSHYGYASASMSRIVEFTGRTKGAVYFHYPSKQALATAVLEHQFGVWARMVSDVESRGLSPIDTMVTLTNEIMEALRDDVVLRAASRLNVDRDAELVLGEPIAGQWIETMQRRMTEAREHGELAADVDIEETARMMVATLIGLSYLAADDGKLADLGTHMNRFWSIYLPQLRKV